MGESFTPKAEEDYQRKKYTWKTPCLPPTTMELRFRPCWRGKYYGLLEGKEVPWMLWRKRWSIPSGLWLISRKSFVSSETMKLENQWTLSHMLRAQPSEAKRIADSEREAQCLALQCSGCFSPFTSKHNIEPNGKGEMFSGPISSITSGFPGGSDCKETASMQEMQVRTLGEVPLEVEMATHSSILAWRIPWTEDPGGLQSMGLKE